jgi:hypothetical protein
MEENPNSKPPITERVVTVEQISTEWFRDYKADLAAKAALETKTQSNKAKLYDMAQINPDAWERVIVQSPRGELLAVITTQCHGGKWVEPCEGYWTDYKPVKRLDIKVAKHTGIQPDPIQAKAKTIAVVEKINQQVNGPVEIQGGER